MAIGSMFGELNKAILGNVLNDRPDTTVEGQPMRAMDNINPMLRGAAQGFGAAVGVDPATLQTSQEAVMSQEAAAKKAKESQIMKHREVLSSQAVALGMDDLAQSILTGDVDNKDALLAIQAKKKANADIEAKALENTNKENAARKVAKAKLEADNKKSRELIEAARLKATALIASDSLKHKREIEMLEAKATKEEEKLAKQAADATVEAEEQDKKALKGAAEFAQGVNTDIAKLRLELLEAGSGRRNWVIAKADPSTVEGAALSSITQIKSKNTKAAMDEFRAASSNGSTGMGSLSAPELEVLQTYIADLNYNMSPEKLEEQLGAIEAYMHKIVGNYETAYGGLDEDPRRGALGLGEKDAPSTQVSPETGVTQTIGW